ncbi:MAG: hypothetical protein DKM50_06570 [Candidatus Margulisiibacteriota bacterium]|nr:MAG: hypothetical protein A2X43_00440 [Candidatus Margulisbacteria bacterium GWD2_39_127]OGI04305.1 MAG: hypothetical protein A2X42_05235 [Candidatus Margulisbacteria bacterium GWF2_38_17]OGI11790.1 MAG: hypothetical protein A2X41_11015 [Candidatus Margulisbacteria bacterium GWE2_39_32]PZM79840.1 MAG: hypothetical protein DKM50_06570 [Candidatus Margulisiibacteriota bacterium]HAR62750.1 hypothetical protein [Candidatus Margulisiibacteriota bacterium]
MKRIIIYVISLILLIAAALFSIQHFLTPQAKQTKSGKIIVYSTVFPIADMVKNIGGNRVKVYTILPPGASPHTFEPTPRDVGNLHKADIIFKVGFGLEFWIDKFIRNIKPEPVIITLSQGIRPIAEAAEHEEESSPSINATPSTSNENASTSEDINLSEMTTQSVTPTQNDYYLNEEEFSSRSLNEITETPNNTPVVNANPHTWLDPINAIHMCELITNTLSEYDPEHRDYYEANFLNYQAELRKLDLDIRTTLSRYKQLKYVTFHPAWDYFDRRYGTKRVAVIEEATGKEPTPTRIRKAIEAVKIYNIRVIFAEPQLNPKVAKAIAEETHARVILIDPFGSEKYKDRNSYIKLMNYNLQKMKEAFR